MWDLFFEKLQIAFAVSLSDENNMRSFSKLNLGFRKVDVGLWLCVRNIFLSRPCDFEKGNVGVVGSFTILIRVNSYSTKGLLNSFFFCFISTEIVWMLHAIFMRRIKSLLLLITFFFIYKSHFFLKNFLSIIADHGINVLQLCDSNNRNFLFNYCILNN